MPSVCISFEKLKEKFLVFIYGGLQNRSGQHAPPVQQGLFKNNTFFYVCVLLKSTLLLIRVITSSKSCKLG